jgi:transcriptional regulator with XRE-family HTH domain
MGGLRKSASNDPYYDGVEISALRPAPPKKPFQQRKEGGFCMARKAVRKEVEIFSTVKKHDSPFTRRLSEMIKARKKETSKAKLLDDLGVSARTLELWEAQQSRPDIDTLPKLAAYFDVTVDYLVGRTDNKAGTIDDVAASERYGLSASTLKRLCDMSSPKNSPGFIEMVSLGISPSAVLSAVNAMLSGEAGLAFLEAFACAIKARDAVNAADTEDKNLPKLQEYAELLHFGAWRELNGAIYEAKHTENC